MTAVALNEAKQHKKLTGLADEQKITPLNKDAQQPKKIVEVFLPYRLSYQCLSGSL